MLLCNQFSLSRQCMQSALSLVKMQYVTESTTYNEHEKLWSGVRRKREVIDTSMPVGALIIEKLLKQPERINQICTHNGLKYSNKQIANISLQIANHFKRLNVQQCDVIGLCARNSDYVAPLVIGASLCGLTLSTLDFSFDKDGIKRIFGITEPKMVFCDGSEYHTIQAAIVELGLKTRIYTLTKHLEGVAEISEFFEESEIFRSEPLKNGAQHVAVIVCSSGTTGLPKGVCLSNETLCNVKLPGLSADGDGDQIVLCFSTLYWISGIWTLVGTLLYGMQRVIIENGFSADAFFAITKNYKVTYFLSPPSQLAAIVNSPNLGSADLSSITLYTCGGSAVPYVLVKKLLPHLPKAKFCVAYGMSEVGGAISIGICTAEKLVGQVVDNIEIVIVNENGNRLGPMETGEIWIHPPVKGLGYYRDPIATAEVYDENGWVHSGDLGYVDSNGDLYLNGRSKEILKYNNFHFLPNEIDNVVSELPGVAEVIVCGIPDIAATFLPAALVVKAAGSEITEQAIYDHVASRMAHFKQLRGGVYFVDELPKTASGKYQRNKAVEVCEALRARNV